MTTPLQDLGFGLTASDFTTPVTEITSAFKIEKAIFERRWKDIATAIKTKNNRDFTVRAIISQDDPEMLEFLFGHTEVSWEDMEGYIRGSKELSLASLRSLLQNFLVLKIFPRQKRCFFYDQINFWPRRLKALPVSQFIKRRLPKTLACEFRTS